MLIGMFNLCIVFERLLSFVEIRVDGWSASLRDAYISVSVSLYSPFYRVFQVVLGRSEKFKNEV